MKTRVIFGVLMGLWPTVGWAFPQGERTYSAVNGIESHKKVVEGVVEEAAAKFSFFIRGIARSRLRGSNPVFDNIKVSYDGVDLTLSSGGSSLSLASKNGGRKPWVTPNGKKVEVEQFVEEKTAKRVYYNRDGRREVVYTISEDLKTLNLTVTVYSKYLDTPVQYQLDYTTQVP